MVELLHQLLLLATQFVWVGGVYRGEIVVAEGVFLAVDCYCTFLIINEMQQPAVVHLVFGATLDYLTFEFELNDGNRLVHPRHELHRAAHPRIFLKITGLERLAAVVAVGIVGKICKGQEVD